MDQFQQEAQRLTAGRRRGSLPFPEALRAFAVRRKFFEAGKYSPACKSAFVSLARQHVPSFDFPLK